AAAGDDPPAAAVARVAAAAAGHAATAALLVRQLVEAIRRGAGDCFVPAGDVALEALLDRSFAALPAAARVAVAAAALGAGDAGDAHAARTAGWLADDARDVDGWRLPSAMHQAALRRQLGAPDLRATVTEALARL